jgi:hypothetical protein
MYEVFNVLMTALRRVLHNKQIFVNEKTIQERREDSVISDQTTKEHFYRTLENYCKERNLAVPSKEIVGKILKKIYGYQEGREASGERRTVWKGVRLKDNDHTNRSLLSPPLKQSVFN